MRHVMTRLIIMVAMGSFIATSANALDISATFNLAASTLANTPVENAANDWTLDLTDGDQIALDVTVSNVPVDLMTAIFASLVTDSVQVGFDGGAFNNILTEESCVGFLCSPATMANLPSSPGAKVNSPLSQMTGTTEWIQAVAHTNVTGAAGAGPDVAVLLAYTYSGVGGSDSVLFDAGATAGDAIQGLVGGASVPITTTYSSATINVPEPGALLASMASLGSVGLIAVARRRA